MDPVTSTALSGMQTSVSRLNASANEVANGDMDGLVTGVVDQITARTDFAANVAVLKTEDQMQKSLLDIKV